LHVLVRIQSARRKKTSDRVSSSDRRGRW
jgi:hypothetical protein